MSPRLLAPASEQRREPASLQAPDAEVGSTRPGVVVSGTGGSGCRGRRRRHARLPRSGWQPHGIRCRRAGSRCFSSGPMVDRMRSARTESSTLVLGCRRIARYPNPLARWTVRCRYGLAFLVRDFERVANQPPMAATVAPAAHALSGIQPTSLDLNSTSRSALCPALRPCARIADTDVCRRLGSSSNKGPLAAMTLPRSGGGCSSAVTSLRRSVSASRSGRLLTGENISTLSGFGPRWTCRAQFSSLTRAVSRSARVSSGCRGVRGADEGWRG